MASSSEVGQSSKLQAQALSPVGKRLWITVYPVNFTGRPEGIYPFYLTVYANYQSKFTITAIQSYIGDRYVTLVGLPDLITEVNRTFTGQLTMPRMSINQTLSIKVLDILNMTMYNSTGINVFCVSAPTGVPFDAFINPNEINLAPGMLWICTVRVWSNDSVARNYYYSVNNMYAFLQVVSNQSPGTPLGFGADLRKQITITALNISGCANGTYAIEFVFYDDALDNLSRVLTVKVEGVKVVSGNGAEQLLAFAGFALWIVFILAVFASAFYILRGTRWSSPSPKPRVPENPTGPTYGEEEEGETLKGAVRSALGIISFLLGFAFLTSGVVVLFLGGGSEGVVLIAIGFLFLGINWFISKPKKPVSRARVVRLPPV